MENTDFVLTSQCSFLPTRCMKLKRNFQLKCIYIMRFTVNIIPKQFKAWDTLDDFEILTNFKTIGYHRHDRFN